MFRDFVSIRDFVDFIQIFWSLAGLDLRMMLGQIAGYDAFHIFSVKNGWPLTYGCH
jgi:hypothetical protein